MSPMIRCHHDRNILAAAVLGGQLEVIRLILSKTYTDHNDPLTDLKAALLNDRDRDWNTPLHFAYTKHQPEVRKLIRQFAGPELAAKLKTSRNLRAKTPDEMLHLQKVVDTDDEEDYKLHPETTKRAVFSGSIPVGERNRLYEAPDCALVTTKAAFKTLEKDMKSLVDKGGFYYEVFDMIETVNMTFAQRIKQKCCGRSQKEQEI